jgi:hypothetical protein
MKFIQALYEVLPLFMKQIRIFLSPSYSGFMYPVVAHDFLKTIYGTRFGNNGKQGHITTKNGMEPFRYL